MRPLIPVLLTTCSLFANAQLDSLVTEQMSLRKIPGMSVAIIKNGKIIEEKGYGLANIELNVPVTTQSIFQTASVGKQFTASLVMLLVQDEKLALDAPISNYLEKTPSTWKGITIRQLLTHTSGLADPYEKIDSRKDYTDEELIKIYGTIPLLFKTGTSWSYSNMGYQVLGFICSRVGGSFYGDQLKERIFNPTGMTTTQIISDRDIVLNRSAGYDWVPLKGLKNQEFLSPTFNRTADGSLYVTIHDMALWDMALNTEKPLTNQQKEIMWTPINVPNSDVKYGFGWFLDSINGHKAISHSGQWQGFTSAQLRLPDDTVSVITLANFSGADMINVTQKIAALYVPDMGIKKQPIEDREPEKSVLFKKIIESIADGTIKPEQFVPEAAAEMFPDWIAEIQTDLSKFGKLTELQLLEKTGDGDTEDFFYRAVFEKQTWTFRVGLDKNKKITYFEGDIE